ncbi:MAG: hypothetical protein D6808_07020 [Candidatus Dadabacteria bacterium]|nr:MAG: hypothetical protein D6808_07020 [Candidatus Dadabacteria bacterium]
MSNGIHDVIRFLSERLSDLDISQQEYTFIVALFALVFALLAFFRGGSRRDIIGYLKLRDVCSKLERLELHCSDIKNSCAHKLSKLDMEVKSLKNDLISLQNSVKLAQSAGSNKVKIIKENVPSSLSYNFRADLREGDVPVFSKKEEGV